MRLPVYTINLDNSNLITLSLVEEPAVDVDFVAFEKREPLRFSIDSEQHLVFGCALRADYPIYREDEGESYYILFTKDVINKLYEDFLISNNQNNVNLQHNPNNYTEGVRLVTSFIKDTDKGIDPRGFEEVADGSWFVGYKILDDDIWSKIKRGEFKGFSVEAFLDLMMTKKEPLNELIDEILSDI